MWKKATRHGHPAAILTLRPWTKSTVLRSFTLTACSAVLSACGAGSSERAEPGMGDYFGAFAYALRAEIWRPSSDCTHDDHDAEWIASAQRMGERDREARSGQVTPDHWRMLDAENRQELATMLAEHGWPQACSLTRQAASELFYVVQHHSDDALRREALPHFDAMVRAGKLRGGEFAMLTDRVLTDAGDRQRFGTQYVCRSGLWVRAETEDPGGLEARRRDIGLIPASLEARLINGGDRAARCRDT